MIAKNSTDFFLLHNFMNRRYILNIDLSNLSIQLFSFLIKLRTFNFSLKGSTLGLLLGIYQLSGPYSCSLVPFLSKIRVTCTEALPYCDSRSDNPDNYFVRDILHKEMFQVLGGTGKNGLKFHHATQNSKQLKT